LKLNVMQSNYKFNQNLSRCGDNGGARWPNPHEGNIITLSNWSGPATMAHDHQHIATPPSRAQTSVNIGDRVSAHHAHAPIAVPGLSLLRMSVPQRLLGAGALLGLLWLGVLWALN
jgi:hypothetical protein